MSLIKQSKLDTNASRIDHIPLFYKEKGQTNSQKIIFISGYVAHQDSFLILEEALAKKYHLVSVSLPMAYGYCKRLKISELVQYVERIAVSVGFDEFELAGFSLGGLVATAYASKFHSKVKQITLLSSSPQLIVSPFFRVIFFILKPILTSSLFARIFVFLNTSPIVRTVVGCQFIFETEIKMMRAHPVQIFTTFFENIIHDFSVEFRQLSIQKKLLFAVDDKIVPWKRYQKLIKSLQAEIIFIEEGGHNLLKEYQEEAALKIWNC